MHRNSLRLKYCAQALLGGTFVEKSCGGVFEGGVCYYTRLGSVLLYVSKMVVCDYSKL